MAYVPIGIKGGFLLAKPPFMRWYFQYWQWLFMADSRLSPITA